MNWKMNWTTAMYWKTIEWMKWAIKKSYYCAFVLRLQVRTLNMGHLLNAMRDERNHTERIRSSWVLGQWTDEQSTTQHNHNLTQYKNFYCLLLARTGSVRTIQFWHSDGKKTARWRCHTSISIDGKMFFTRIEATAANLPLRSVCYCNIDGF